MQPATSILQADRRRRPADGRASLQLAPDAPAVTEAGAPPIAPANRYRGARAASLVSRALLALMNTAFFVLAVAPFILVGLTLHVILLFAYRPAADRPLPDRAPLVIVLGGGSTHSDERTGQVSRFDRGVRLVEAGHADWIHFSGGGAQGGISEGEYLARRARERLPHARITFEGQSHTTLQNAYFTVDAIGPPPSGSILVTDATHLFRAWASFLWAGGTVLYPMPAADFDLRSPAERASQLWLETGAVWLNVARVLAFTLRGSDPAHADVLASVSP